MPFNYIEIDLLRNVVHTDEGHILGIESYHDKYDEPCLPEDAEYASVITGTHSFDKAYIERDEY